MRKALILLLFLGPSLPAPAQEPPPLVPPGLENSPPRGAEEVEPLLRKFRETHASPFEEGLRSFQVRASFLNLAPNRPPLRVLLEWKGPGKESLEVVPSPGRGRRRKLPAGKDRKPPGKNWKKKKKKDWRTGYLKGLGDALAGASLRVFLSQGGPARAGTPGKGPGGGKEVPLRVFKGRNLEGTAWFAPSTGLLVRLEDKVHLVRFTYGKIGKRWVLERLESRRKAQGKGKSRARVFMFSAYRKIQGYFFPTRLTTRDPKGPVEIALSFILVDGKPALAEAADPKVAEEKVKAFEAGWHKWNVPEKIQAVKDLEEVGGPRAARALARKLRDGSPAVREAIVRALGDLREREALPFLLRAMERSRKNPAFFALVCGALGEIGDPRAAKPLAKKILSGDTRSPGWRVLAQARINALAKIRAPEAVDELIKLLSIAGGGGRRATRGGGKGPIYKYVRAALKRLTGQEFKFAFQWHRWWKENRARLFRKRKG